MASAAAAKKWPPASPGLPVPDQTDISLVNQGGGLEGLARLLRGQPCGGELRSSS